ncbi:TPA: hypothetical protein HND23_24860 [Escherichia coli]|nr:hypothetical protein [Escherichia coli]
MKASSFRLRGYCNHPKAFLSDCWNIGWSQKRQLMQIQVNKKGNLPSTQPYEHVDFIMNVMF